MRIFTWRGFRNYIFDTKFGNLVTYLVSWRLNDLFGDLTTYLATILGHIWHDWVFWEPFGFESSRNIRESLNSVHQWTSIQSVGDLYSVTIFVIMRISAGEVFWQLLFLHQMWWLGDLFGNFTTYLATWRIFGTYLAWLCLLRTFWSRTISKIPWAFK